MKGSLLTSQSTGDALALIAQLAADPQAVSQKLQPLLDASAKHAAMGEELKRRRQETLAGEKALLQRTQALTAQSAALDARGKELDHFVAQNTTMNQVERDKIVAERIKLVQEQGQLADDEQALLDAKTSLLAAQKALDDRAGRLMASEEQLAADRAAFESEKAKHLAWHADNEAALAAARKLIGA